MPRMRLLISITALLGSAVAIALGAQSAPWDLLIRNGLIVDGTGAAWYRGDVAIRGDVIVAMAARLVGPAARTIDAAGHVVAPGFIDVHTHARRGIFEVPTAPNYVRQGVTTVIEGPDGSSAVPLAPFLEKLNGLQKSVNIGSFIGQGSIRSEVIGNEDRKATTAEIERMRMLVKQGMKDGAFGLSTGLFYVPGTFTPIGEVVELARVAGRFGGIHKSHQRDEASRVLDSFRETIAIGEQGGLPTQATHAKVVGKAHWGKSVDVLTLVDEARARGVDVTIDQYPYTASSTSVAAALLPAWVLEGGREEQRQRLADPATRAKVKAGSVAMIRDERGGGDPKNVQLAHCGFDASLAGKTIADVTRQRGMEPTVENAAETTMWIVEPGGCQGIFHAMADEDLERILRHPVTMVASDGEVPIFGRAAPTRTRAATARSRACSGGMCATARC